MVRVLRWEAELNVCPVLSPVEKITSQSLLGSEVPITAMSSHLIQRSLRLVRISKNNEVHLAHFPPTPVTLRNVALKSRTSSLPPAIISLSMCQSRGSSCGLVAGPLTYIQRIIEVWALGGRLFPPLWLPWSPIPFICAHLHVL